MAMCPCLSRVSFNFLPPARIDRTGLHGSSSCRLAVGWVTFTFGIVRLDPPGESEGGAMDHNGRKLVYKAGAGREELPGDSGTTVSLSTAGIKLVPVWLTTTPYAFRDQRSDLTSLAGPSTVVTPGFFPFMGQNWQDLNSSRIIKIDVDITSQFYNQM
ncbi:uncharacterized protein BO96DRAFT_438220 [Aspergillus niger CBS 101883]|uniref:uncharacterized protein n=1 Tax=Aspergillus lacticoffeatus (strain CBS 101883) TaxID=1450533 RepID=UPI000D7F6381|nr:uncharacterized protein BO96DRAFT_438220 [Aspergillus niger CBS 101883]PYH52171.1 hypothetical protein BO96DRAFT_438220 [Aspergillus niger CBS 101883]